MFRRKHASHFDSSDADQRKAKVVLKVVILLDFFNKKTQLLIAHNFFFFSISDTTIRSEQIDELKSALQPLSARGEKYCNEACFTRYLKARDWNVAKSKKMLEDSLKWRTAYRPEDICWVNPPFNFYLACIPHSSSYYSI